MQNALSPDRMTAAERLDEAAGILAAGFLRLRARKSRRLSAENGESLLDFLVDRSVHGTDETRTGEQE